MSTVAEALNETRIREALNLPEAGVQALDTVDSTNLRLKEAARAGRVSPPFLLAAERQTAGRGRLGRRFPGR